MKLDKLVKTLRRELAANPMKAGVLGVLLLGGMYFWGPLAWKWMAKKGVPVAPGAVGASTPAMEHASGKVATAQPVVEGTALKETIIAWQDIHKQRETDPLARSADYRPKWNQIFQVAAVTPVVERRVEVESNRQEESDPRDLGFVLQGVFIGSKSKKAIVSGKVYREGDLISVSQSTDAKSVKDRQPELAFRLVRVHRKMVEVEREGRTWQLKLATAEPEKTNAEVTNAAPTHEEAPLDEKAVSPDQK